MALRVLLADESSTIKRVIALSLQDYPAEVQSVHLGVDVLETARSFKPDIIFADVLLQKKNGYEVCAELKKDSDLKGIPVVLIWSGFMELDEVKLQFANPDAKLEKPFDADTLRNLVKNLIQKPTGKPAADASPKPKKSAAPASVPEAKTSDDINDFLNLPGVANDFLKEIQRVDKKTSNDVNQTVSHGEDQWEMLKLGSVPDGTGTEKSDITKFKIEVPENEDSHVTVEYDLTQDDLDFAGPEVETANRNPVPQLSEPQFFALDPAAPAQPSQSQQQQQPVGTAQPIQPLYQSQQQMPVQGTMPPQEMIMPIQGAPIPNALPIQEPPVQGLSTSQGAPVPGIAAPGMLAQGSAPAPGAPMYNRMPQAQQSTMPPLAMPISPSQHAPAYTSSTPLMTPSGPVQQLDADQKNEVIERVVQNILLTLTPEKIEEIIQKQAQKTIETIAQRVVADTAEKVIKTELERLLRDLDSSAGLTS